MIESVDLKERSAMNGLKGAKGTLLPALYLTGGMNTNYSNLAEGQTFVNTTQENTGQYVTVGGTNYDVYTPQNNYSAHTLGYGYQLSNNINYYVGLQLNIPILNGFSARTRVRNARIAEETARFNQSTARLQLRQAISTDYVNMTSAYRSYMALQQQVADYQQAYNAALARLDNGVITSYDFVISKNNLDGATLNLIGAKYNFILQSKILDYYMGRLTL
jgi:outer membrane protein